MEEASRGQEVGALVAPRLLWSCATNGRARGAKRVHSVNRDRNPALSAPWRARTQTSLAASSRLANNDFHTVFFPSLPSLMSEGGRGERLLTNPRNPMGAVQETQRLLSEPGEWFCSCCCELACDECCWCPELTTLFRAFYAAPGISASPSEDNLRYFNVLILGPSQSPYEGASARHRATSLVRARFSVRGVVERTEARASHLPCLLSPSTRRRVQAGALPSRGVPNVGAEGVPADAEDRPRWQQIVGESFRVDDKAESLAMHVRGVSGSLPHEDLPPEHRQGVWKSRPVRVVRAC